MPKQDYTDITIVLDRSGSMSSVLNDTIGGFNTFLADQKAAPGEATITLVQFDDKYEVNYKATALKDAAELTTKTFQPRGMTALYDAIGKTIVTTGERLAALKEDDRPDKVIFVIITDGEENASKEYAQAKVKEMVMHQTVEYSWEFVFLGANIDAERTGMTLGVAPQSSMTFAANSAGVGATFSAVSANLCSYRSMKSDDYKLQKSSGAFAFFSQEDKDAQKQAGA